MISSFKGRYDFLSNFYPCIIPWNGGKYSSVEHAYQATKCVFPKDRERIRKAPTPKVAKEIGRKVAIVPWWEDIKVDVMRELLIKKFRRYELKKRLLKTGDEELVEGNWWGDRFWGVCRGRGENWLGRLLMETRQFYRDEEVSKEFWINFWANLGEG